MKVLLKAFVMVCMGRSLDRRVAVSRLPGVCLGLWPCKAAAQDRLRSPVWGLHALGHGAARPCLRRARQTTLWLLEAQEEGLGSKVSRSLLAAPHRQQEGRPLRHVSIDKTGLGSSLVSLADGFASYEYIRIQTATRKFLAPGAKLPDWTRHLAILSTFRQNASRCKCCR